MKARTFEEFAAMPHHSGHGCHDCYAAKTEAENGLVSPCQRHYDTIWCYAWRKEKYGEQTIAKFWASDRRQHYSV